MKSKTQISGSVVSSDLLDSIPRQEGSSRRYHSEIMVEITCDYGDYKTTRLRGLYYIRVQEYKILSLVFFLYSRKRLDSNVF